MRQHDFNSGSNAKVRNIPLSLRHFVASEGLRERETDFGNSIFSCSARQLFKAALGICMSALDKYSRETFLYDRITQYGDKLMSRERLSITLQVENNILPSFMQSSSSRIPWRAACATLRLPRSLPRSDRDLYNSPQNAFCHPANQIVVFRV